MHHIKDLPVSVQFVANKCTEQHLIPFGIKIMADRTGLFGLPALTLRVITKNVMIKSVPDRFVEPFEPRLCPCNTYHTHCSGSGF